MTCMREENAHPSSLSPSLPPSLFPTPGFDEGSIACLAPLGVELFDLFNNRRHSHNEITSLPIQTRLAKCSTGQTRSPHNSHFNSIIIGENVAMQL